MDTFQSPSFNVKSEQSESTPKINIPSSGTFNQRKQHQQHQKDEHKSEDDVENDIYNLTQPFSAIQIDPLLKSPESSTKLDFHENSKSISSLSDNVQDVLSKRGSDHLTIEGSPFRTQSKRLDTNNTPQYPLSKNHEVIRSMNSNHSSNDNDNDNDNHDNHHHIVVSHTISVKNDETQKVTGKVKVIISGGKHDTGNHQENFMRLALLIGEENGCLNRKEVINYISMMDDTKNPRKANLADLLRVHEFEYLQHLETKAKAIAAMTTSETSSEPISTSTTSTIPTFYAPVGHLDIDTPLGLSSLDAAKSYCGAAMTAVDLAMSKQDRSENDRILVLGRPPGHHAGANGCVVSDYYWRRPDMSSSGFCLLNTVAVAAAYARYKYGSISQMNTMGSNCPYPPKIAIVDFDIHHGNGTEDIVRNLRPRQIHLPLPSSWAPMTKLVYKPWLNENDAEDVLFVSINLVAEDRFYPCSGADGIDGNVINIGLTPIGPGPWDQKARTKLSLKDRIDLCKQASEEFRMKISSTLIPKLKHFKPDILFFSSGFDGHYDDFYHFLSENDFHWITNQLCTITKESNGVVISVLEGGYSLSSPLPPVPRTSKNSTNSKHNPTTTASSSVISSSTITTDPSMLESLKYAQKPGDGGLVKGILAHVAALASKEAWL